MQGAQLALPSVFGDTIAFAEERKQKSPSNHDRFVGASVGTESHSRIDH